MSTAAPTIFTPLELDGESYFDGAFLANNPTAVRACMAQQGKGLSDERV